MESTEKKSITLMLTVDDFRALCNMVHVIRENGMRLINGGARVSFDIDKCGINEESIANLKNLKKSEKTGRLQLQMEWSSWCAVTHLVDKLNAQPAKAKTINFDLEEWQLTALLKIR